ncbi:endocuticle structural protein SgAbd-6-like [Macrosteles quadrilineatus]|uniref:endocuticle structural protein SgAbd-6-like n=1 Tax=Macrosteles quadrilineatus TaxID=74068 RepID=UPI0023E26AE2|nr:endocuticle structural protein SgAbd-6-like [Macrosteles quadrilineatus]
MLLKVVLLCCVAGALARPQGPGAATIVRYVSENTGIDGYNFEYETSDGVIRKETGVLQNAGTDNEIMVVTGSVTWTGDDGKKYTINFTADQDGYKPVIS